MRLFVQYASGFSAQPFSWSVQVSETGGQIELVWKTSSSPPATEHRQQVQTLPMWCMEAMFTLGDIDFTALPPAAKWSVGLDDAPTLALSYEVEDEHKEFSIFYAPKLWPTLPASTKAALQQLPALLEPVARELHFGTP
jgi:hypothetical protein